MDKGRRAHINTMCQLPGVYVCNSVYLLTLAILLSCGLANYCDISQSQFLTNPPKCTLLESNAHRDTMRIYDQLYKFIQGVTAIASYPRSGSTLFRGALERGTGFSRVSCGSISFSHVYFIQD